MSLGTCPNCGRGMHALDGSMSTNGEGFRHINCDRAAQIDYKAAFDRLHEAMCDIQYLTHDLAECSFDGWMDRDPATEQTIASLWVKPGEALDHHWLKTGERRNHVA